jgi:hypothetical protein
MNSAATSTLNDDLDALASITAKRVCPCPRHGGAWCSHDGFSLLSSRAATSASASKSLLAHRHSRAKRTAAQQDWVARNSDPTDLGLILNTANTRDGKAGARQNRVARPASGQLGALIEEYVGRSTPARSAVRKRSAAGRCSTGKLGPGMVVSASGKVTVMGSAG